MEKKILTLLENDSHLSTAEIAAMIDESEEDVAACIKKMENDKIICGYNTLVNWEKVDEERVTALIGVKISPVRGVGFDRIASRISRFSEVKSVYLMSGSSNDLILGIEGSSLKEVSHFVYEKIAPMESVVSTATYFVLKKYKDHNVILTNDKETDDRIQIQA